MKALLFLFASFFLLSCQQAEKLTSTVKKQVGEPEHVEVQHILIAFKGSLPGKETERTKAEAEKLARHIYETLQKHPEQFEELLIAHSDDMIPGKYSLSNRNISPGKDEIPRDQFRKAFGDMAFELDVEEIGLVPHHEKDAPYGFHIVKRLK